MLGTTFLIFAGVIVVYLAIAAGLIASQSPRAPTTSNGGLDFTATTGRDNSHPPQLLPYTARDGTVLGYRHYASVAPTPERTLILLHGSGWHGRQFHVMATAIAAEGAADVVVPDLRGHGEFPVRRGDVDYIGQLEDDLADLIAKVRTDASGTEIIVGGHSSGGGLVVRFAGSRQGVQADRFVLLAPFLKYDAPTTRPNSGGWAHPAIRRIIGLSLLNQIGITALNHLPIIAFAMPKSVREGPLGATVTLTYSYRLNTSYAPRANFGADLSAMRQPFSLLAGSEDEAFVPDAYAPLVSTFTPSGTYTIVQGANHLSVVNDPATIATIIRWIKGRRSMGSGQVGAP